MKITDLIQQLKAYPNDYTVQVREERVNDTHLQGDMKTLINVKKNKVVLLVGQQ